MRKVTFGFRIAGIVVAIALVSSVASIPLRMNLNNGSTPLEALSAALMGTVLPDAYGAKPKGKDFKTDDSGTPFQRGLKKGIDDNRGNGKPHPHSDTYTTEVTTEDNKIKIKGKSELKFNNPGEAGKGRWDNYVVGNGPGTGTGTINPGDYTQDVIDKVNADALASSGKHVYKNDDDHDGLVDEDDVNGINDDNDCRNASGDILRGAACFDESGDLLPGLTELVDEDPEGQFEFGEEPRQLTIDEEYTLTFADEAEASAAFFAIMSDEDPVLAASELVSAATATTTRNVLMGFTIEGPHIDWTIGTKEEVCFIGCFTLFEAKAGFALDYGLGLRLPAQVSITTVDEMVEEQAYTTSTTSLIPLDFSAAQYDELGVPPNSGNEFVAFLEFFLGVKVVIAEITVIDWNIDTDVDLAALCTQFTIDSPILEDVDCANFVTPFGLDEDGVPREFPLPTVTLPADVTGLQLPIAGATFGIGLKLDPHIGSEHISADWFADGDATGGGTINYAAAGTEYGFGPVTAGNFDGGTDNAQIHIEEFSFHVTEMSITLSANIDLGGWLDFVPDLPYFEIITLDLADLGFDLTIGQHSGTSGAQADVFVVHYGVDIEVAPATQDIEPGFPGDYTVTVTNTGNRPDTFDTFAVNGLLPNWESSMSASEVALAPSASTAFVASITPYRHYTTSPGDYPFNVSGASEGAKAYSLVRTDTDGAIVHALPFFEPHLSIVPLSQEKLPGETAFYLITVENFGNVPDSAVLEITYLDFGTAYRAVPTAIPLSWTALGTTSFGPFDPGEGASTTLEIDIPGTWEGMEDTTYEFTGTATSDTDPTAVVSETAGLEVTATKESMARYIDLEILALIDDVTAAPINPDVQASLLDKLNGAEAKKLQALSYILDDRFNNADNMLKSTADKMKAFVSQSTSQKNKAIPAALADDWIARGNQVVADLETAIAQPT